MGTFYDLGSWLFLLNRVFTEIHQRSWNVYSLFTKHGIRNRLVLQEMHGICLRQCAWRDTVPNYRFERMYAMNQKAKTPESHKSDIHNANKGSSGTNKAWDKKHGNRGKQMNPNQANQAKS
jgi:hypothetical protein